MTNKPNTKTRRAIETCQRPSQLIELGTSVGIRLGARWQQSRSVERGVPRVFEDVEAARKAIVGVHQPIGADDQVVHLYGAALVSRNVRGANQAISFGSVGFLIE